MLQHSGIDVHNDELHIHPESFCGSCRTKGKRNFDAKQPKNSLHAYQWTEHAQSGCAVCSLFMAHKGGRPNKQRNKHGRPCKGSNKSVASSILRNAPTSMKADTPLSLSRFLPPNMVSLHDLQCGICGCTEKSSVHRASLLSSP